MLPPSNIRFPMVSCSRREKNKLDSNLNKFREWAVATYTSASCCPKSKLDYLGVSTLLLVAINTRYMSYFKQLLDHKLVGNQVHMWLTSRLAARFFPRRTLRRRWKCGSAHHRSSAHGGLMAWGMGRDAIFPWGLKVGYPKISWFVIIFSWFLAKTGRNNEE